MDLTVRSGGAAAVTIAVRVVVPVSGSYVFFADTVLPALASSTTAVAAATGNESAGVHAWRSDGRDISQPAAESERQPDSLKTHHLL